MSVPVRYEAFWVPGLQHEIDGDESLGHGFQWLASAEQSYEGAGVIVMYAKSMVGHAPRLGQAAQRWEVVSPRSTRPWGTGPVLAIWPSDPRVLEFAEGLALNSGLCVIAGRYDIAPWIRKTQAACLVEGYETGDTEESLSSEISRGLDGMLSFDGHNGFIGAGGKEDAIRTLRAIAQMKERPSPEAIEAYLLSSGETSADGANRACRWYEEILAGKSHRDYAGGTLR